MNLVNRKIYIAGSGGMVGSSVARKLANIGCASLLTPSSSELDLLRQSLVEDFFFSEKPEIVIVAAAKVGGILANNKFRAEFIYDNLLIEANIIEASRKANVQKLIFLGSSCVYPKFAQQPMKEEQLLSGYLEFTNEPYAIAKIAGIKLCENYHRQYGSNFFSVMPTNLFGPNDNFDLETSHVIPALIRKFHVAKLRGDSKVIIWGSGKPLREFLYVEDLADAIVFLLEKLDAASLIENGISHLNIGSGEEIEIGKLAELIGTLVGFEGKIEYDTSKPDGTPRKLLDVSRIEKLGWKHMTSLSDGLKRTYEWYVENSIA